MLWDSYEGRRQLGWDRPCWTRGKKNSRGDSRSVMETMERGEEDSCCCVDHTLLSPHISNKRCGAFSIDDEALVSSAIRCRMI